MYQLIEASLADLTRLYQYKQQEIFKTDFSLKGFDYPWIITSRDWKTGEKVLDVGAAYSPLPMYIQESCGVEMWVADDYGMNSNDPFWTRNASPQEHIAKHPEVKFVVERLGDSDGSALPRGYFDVIYSASVLEHVPYAILPEVWRHMDLLLKPGGEMLHAVDIPFPSNGGLKKVLMGLCLDAFNPLIPAGFRLRHFLATPRNYTRLVCSQLGVQPVKMQDISVLNMVLNPDILTESYAYGLKRIVKDNMKDYRYQRVGTLLLRFKKSLGN
ncbi:MAG: class I SAM-dependent methyltransferase [Chloroflexota bacterium]|nr:MAG: class I SAM-dependent methyltransferase [Chloroflexota bacterium]